MTTPPQPPLITQKNHFKFLQQQQQHQNSFITINNKSKKKTLTKSDLASLGTLPAWKVVLAGRGSSPRCSRKTSS